MLLERTRKWQSNLIVKRITLCLRILKSLKYSVQMHGTWASKKDLSLMKRIRITIRVMNGELIRTIKNMVSRLNQSLVMQDASRVIGEIK